MTPFDPQLRPEQAAEHRVRHTSRCTANEAENRTDVAKQHVIFQLRDPVS
jgi:hypothetical protein